MLAVAPESMHLNALGTSAVLWHLVAAQLIDVFQLEVDTQEAELIQAASSKSWCRQGTTSRHDFWVVSVSSI